MKWKEEEEELLKKLYCDNGSDFLSKKLDRNRKSVIKKANKLGLFISDDLKSSLSKISGYQRRGYKNDNYSVTDITNNIDEYKSYILGLIWSDGYLPKNKNSGYINLTMFKEDLMEVDWIFKKTGNWYIYDRNSEGRKPQLSMTAYNPILYDKLIEMNYDKKSYISPYKISNLIPKDLIRYFIRGIVDGDGCFYLNKNQYTYQFSISSTYDQDWSFFLNLFSEIGLDFSTIRRIHKRKLDIDTKSSFIRLCKRDKISYFINWLYDGYENDRIGFSRKYNKSILFHK